MIQLLAFQVLAHLSIIAMFMFAGWQQWLIAFFVYFLTGSIGMSGTYHRLLTHRSYKVPVWWEYMGTIFATLGGTGSSIAWCAVHREHHRYTDKDQDPHSPHVHGFWRVQFLSMFYKPNVRYVPDLLRSKFHNGMHKYYWAVHAIYATICYLIDPFSVVYAYLFPSFVLWHMGSAINTLSHMWGWQDYDTKDTSTNHPFLGVFMWGEGWHNNHHAFPADYEFGRKWWQIDITKYIIKGIKK